MNTSDIAVAYVLFVDGSNGKRRPIFILEDNNDTISFFNITSQYESKSAKVKQQYFQINDLAIAGLDKPSWIDVGNPITALREYLGEVIKIGHLSRQDEARLAEFIVNYNKNN